MYCSEFHLVQTIIQISCIQRVQQFGASTNSEVQEINFWHRGDYSSRDGGRDQ